MKRLNVIFFVLVLSIIFINLLFSQVKSTGQSLYMDNCATCHGDRFQGGNAQSLTDGDWQYGSKDSHVFRNIKFGISHLGMPGFEGALSDEEINQIITFVKEEEAKATKIEPEQELILQTLDYKVAASTWVDGLEIPWAIVFIDKNQALITERPGRLRLVENGKLNELSVANIPAVLHEGQGGLLDVAIDPNYSENGWVYLAYSHKLSDISGQRRPPAMTRIVRGQIKDLNWTNEEVVFEASPEHYLETRHHYGCRIVFDNKGHLFFSIGERGKSDHAQDFTRPNGKIHRIYPDGSIPENNPFVGKETALPTIYTYGNRNPQGLAIHPETDLLWAAEHGPMGGDELNLLAAGKNYGWPEVTYGRNYNGSIITEFTKKPGMEAPILYWKPSIAVCGIDFYEGDMFPRWNNHLMVGALKYEEVRLLDIEENRVLHEEIILKNKGRVRDVTADPEGAIYIVLNNPDKIMRLTRKDK
jgi:glucose/arabinose dehydrogenase